MKMFFSISKVFRKAESTHTDLLTGKFSSLDSSSWGSAMRLLPVGAPPLFLGVSLKAPAKI